MPVSSSAMIHQRARQVDLSDEEDTADFIDRTENTANCLLKPSIVDTEKSLPEESVSDRVLYSKRSRPLMNLKTSALKKICQRNPFPISKKTSLPMAPKTRVTKTSPPKNQLPTDMSHDEDSLCKEVESADFATKHRNQQGKK
ncbi:hypothetical protein E4U50_003866 [Claviceps purpurea]|nr:hypothetical protein E4U50_003866 [Claviceps purpurea]